MPPLGGLSLTQHFVSLASINRQGIDLLLMSGPRRAHQNKDGGMRATGRMLSPYPPTMEKRPDLVAHRHRPVLPNIVKITRLTIVRICPHQSSAASSSATTRSRPVMTESATKDTRAGHAMTLRVRQETVTGVRNRRRVTARRLTHHHLRLRHHQEFSMAEEACVVHAAHPLWTRRREARSHTTHVRG